MSCTIQVRVVAPATRWMQREQNGSFGQHKKPRLWQQQHKQAWRTRPARQLAHLLCGAGSHAFLVLRHQHPRPPHLLPAPVAVIGTGTDRGKGSGRRRRRERGGREDERVPGAGEEAGIIQMTPTARISKITGTTARMPPAAAVAAVGVVETGEGITRVAAVPAVQAGAAGVAGVGVGTSTSTVVDIGIAIESTSTGGIDPPPHPGHDHGTVMGTDTLTPRTIAHMRLRLRLRLGRRKEAGREGIGHGRGDGLGGEEALPLQVQCEVMRCKPCPDCLCSCCLLFLRHHTRLPLDLLRTRQ